MKRVIQDLEYRAISIINRMMQDVDKGAHPDIYEFLYTEYLIYQQVKFVLERFAADDLESLVDVSFPEKRLSSVILFVQEGKDLLRNTIDNAEKLEQAYNEYGDAVQLLEQFYMS